MPIFVQMATLLEVPWATSLNLRQNYSFGLRLLNSPLVFFWCVYLHPCLVVLNYNLVICCYRSLRLFYLYDIFIAVKSVTNISLMIVNKHVDGSSMISSLVSNAVKLMPGFDRSMYVHIQHRKPCNFFNHFLLIDWFLQVCVPHRVQTCPLLTSICMDTLRTRCSERPLPQSMN